MARVLMIIFAAIVTAYSGVSSAQPYRTVPEEEKESALKDVCEKSTCLNGMRIVLKQRDGSLYDKTFDSMPVIHPEGVVVYAGQTVLFEANLEGDVLTHFKLVDTIQQPQKTFSATLKQDDKGQMTLIMRNPLERALRISMQVMRLDSEDLERTSSCPVVAKGGSYELWPYPIFQVWLGDLRLLKDSDDMQCVE